MDIRTKLVFAYVAVALGSMLAMGAATYVEVSALLRNRTLDQLAGLADAKKDELEIIVAGWRESVAAASHQGSLLEALRDLEDGRSASTTGLDEALGHAIGSSASMESLAVYDTDGTLVASSGPEEVPIPDRVAAVEGEVAYRGVDVSRASQPRIDFTAPLELDGRRLGTMYVRLVGDALTRLTGAYAGLGETGEALVVAPLDSARAVLLHPVRFAGESTGTLDLNGDSGDIVSLALGGSERTRWEDATDYRGVPVWAATRYLPETGWGLVVKVDDREEREPVLAFRGRLTRLGVSLSAFAILLGTLLGFRLAQPIHDLAAVADEIRGGSLDARADVKREDEVGLLARTFNEMADELERRMASLQEYRKFFDVSLDMLCIAGTDGFFKQTNPSFERILGWTEEELLTRSFLEIVHPDDVEPTERELEKLAQGIPTISFVNRFRCADGAYKRLLWTSFPDAETGRLYAIAHEVKERESL